MKYARDVILFCIGAIIVLKQAGILLSPPEGGPQKELIILGALFCNGPLVLQFLALRFGTSGSPRAPARSEPESPPAPSSAPSSGVDR